MLSSFRSLLKLLLILQLLVSGEMFASNPPPSHETRSLAELVQRAESDREEIEDPVLLPKVKEFFRLSRSITEIHIALVRGDKALFEDKLSKLDLKGFGSSSDGIYLARQVSQLLSLATELGWTVNDQNGAAIQEASIAQPTQDITHAYEKISWYYRLGNVAKVSEVLDELKPLDADSNSWETFVYALGNYYLYKLGFTKENLYRSKELLEGIHHEELMGSKMESSSDVLFQVRVSMLFVSVTMSLLDIEESPKVKALNLVDAFSIWQVGYIPMLLIDHPALWGWQMHLLGNLLNERLRQLRSQDYYYEVTAKNIAFRRDEALFRASQYR